MAICLSCVLTWIVVGTGLYFIYNKFFAKKKYISGEYQKDVVYLHQFPRSKAMPNASPFCLKIETFLRINKIKYECVYTATARSNQGLLPYVILNGQQFDDSELIIDKLSTHFNVKGLDGRQEALSHAVSRLADNHLFYILIKYKILSDEGTTFITGALKDFKLDQKLHPTIFNIAVTLGTAVFRYKVRGRISAGLSLFPEEDFNSLLRKDLDSIRDIIGEQKFLFGDSLTTADCTVFGQLATVYYLPHSTHVKKTIDQHYPTLKKYMETVKNTVFEKDFTL